LTINDFFCILRRRKQMPTIRDWEDYSDEAQEQIIREKTNRKLKNIQKKEKQKNENKYKNGHNPPTNIT
tara:strand:- start:150 stop:356 length:207 start_codon:yes stop_codon:yes gene_type:complete